MNNSSIRPDAVIPRAGSLDQVTTKEQRQQVMRRAETWIENVGPQLRPVENAIIRDLLMELALLDGAYELLSSVHRVSTS